MANLDEQIISVLVGATCPTCASDDLRWRAPLGALQHGQCRDCGTEYHWYQASDATPSCESCGLPNHWEPDGPYCEDCALSDCVYCGAPVHRWDLSANLACRMCELGEVEAA